MIFLKFFFKKVLQKRNNALYLHSRLRNNGNSENASYGGLAQLVQSACLTSRMSAVRIRHSPPKPYGNVRLFSFVETTFDMFYTYILYSTSKDRFYIGSTENPLERLKKHNYSNKGFTNRASDWKIVYLKEFETKSDSMLFEKKIKNWKSRMMIQKLIDSVGSECPDLP